MTSPRRERSRGFRAASAPRVQPRRKFSGKGAYRQAIWREALQGRVRGRGVRWLALDNESLRHRDRWGAGTERSVCARLMYGIGQCLTWLSFCAGITGVTTPYAFVEGGYDVTVFAKIAMLVWKRHSRMEEPAMGRSGINFQPSFRASLAGLRQAVASAYRRSSPA
jgi:hypothetical protein